MRGQRGNPSAQRGACVLPTASPNGSAPVAHPPQAPPLISTTPAHRPRPTIRARPQAAPPSSYSPENSASTGALPPPRWRPRWRPRPSPRPRLGRTSASWAAEPAGVAEIRRLPAGAAPSPPPASRSLPQVLWSGSAWLAARGRAALPAVAHPLLKRRREDEVSGAAPGRQRRDAGRVPAAGLPPPRGCLRAASWRHPRLLPGRPRPKTPASAGRSPHNASGQLSRRRRYRAALRGAPAARGRTAAAFAELFRAALPGRLQPRRGLSPRPWPGPGEQLDFGPSALHHNTVADRMP